LKETLETYISDKVLKVKSGVTVAVVLDLIRAHAFDYIQHVFVTDHSNKFLGTIELSVLLRSEPTKIIDSLIVILHLTEVFSSFLFLIKMASLWV
jgi:Mg/Co/Ni transporter MgtE